MDIVKTLNKWSEARLNARRLKEFGGIQKCTWCRQIANQNDTWFFKAWDKDPMLDVLTCGVCGGTSLWRFEIGMIYIGPLSPPEADHSGVDYYDIATASLVRKSETPQ